MNTYFLFWSATYEIYTLSLHDALPISKWLSLPVLPQKVALEREHAFGMAWAREVDLRSEEHTSELQSHSDLVCRLLLEKKIQSSRTCYFCVIDRKNGKSLLTVPYGPVN